MKVKVKVAKSSPTLCDHMDYTVYEILQASILGSLSLLQGIFSTQGRIGGSLIGNWNFYPNPVIMRSTFWGENRGPTGNLNFYLHLVVTRGHFPSPINPPPEQKPVRTGG